MIEDHIADHKRSVFFVSDGTGITAETLGRSLLTQFENIVFVQTLLPFVDNPEKARVAVERIDRAARADRVRPIVFSTLIDKSVRDVIGRSQGLLIEFFDTFTGPLEKELGMAASHVTGRSHGMGSHEAYTARIGSVHYALNNDDGVSTRNYGLADVIIIGVSRCGKTPTCLYLALNYGINAANYPITEDDFEGGGLPIGLLPFREKLFGLTIDPERLQQIRSERRPNTRYATLEQCIFEVTTTEKMYEKEKIRYLNTTTMSIEEIAASIMVQAGLRRHI